MYTVENNTNLVFEPEADYGFTYGEYLNWQLGEMVELIKGRIFRMSPAPSTNHQMILNKFQLKIGNYFEKNNCNYFVAPTDVVLPFNLNDANKATTVVQPDIFVVCDKSKITLNAVIGAPDWIIEIISPHTAKKDLQYKYEVYEEAEVKEYWTVFPNARAINIYYLNENKEFQLSKVHEYKGEVSPLLYPEIVFDIESLFIDLL